MKRIILSLLGGLWLALGWSAVVMADCPELLQFSRAPLAGKGAEVDLCQAYQGKVILVVNTASKCGYTPQYEGLESLYRRYQARGLVVLGFPSNDFAGQEPGSEAQIAEFCKLTYGVKFPMFAKTEVAQGTSDPFFRALAAAAGEYPQWNFHKYLLDRQGRLVASFPSRAKPEGGQLERKILDLL